MALRETRGQHRANGGESCSAEAILRSIQDPTDNVAGLRDQLKLYLAPLTAVASRKGPKDKENRQQAEEHGLAKQHLPFLVQLLKLCSGSLTTSQAKLGTDAQKKADELFSAMALALDSLHQLRAWLTSCSHEIEIQRYRLVRLLITWKRHREALAQCWEVYRSLCTTVLAGDGPAAQPKVAASGKGRGRKVHALEIVEDFRLPPPQPGHESSSLPMLVTGVALDLVLCAAEDVNTSATMLQMLASLPDELDPWLRVLPFGSAEKQKDIMFKGLYKLALLLAEEPQNYAPEIVHKFCVVAIHRCADSSQCGQYVKVSRRLCSSLSIHAPKLAVSVCNASLGGILQIEQLSLLSRSSEMLDLMDCYARLCQMADCTSEGSEEIQRLLHTANTHASVLMAVVGLYAVGLQLAGDERIEEKGGQFCELLENAAAAVHTLLDQELAGLQRATSRYARSQGDTNEMRNSSYSSPQNASSVFRALDYVRKSSSKFVQSTWNAYVSSSCSAAAASHSYRTLNKMLGHILHLFCMFATKCLSQAGFSDSEADVISKGQKSVAVAALAALRLSVIADGETERQVLVLRDIIQRSPVDTEELRWLMSSTYNMGVQIFNAAKYELACSPLRLAYEAACAKMKAGLVNYPEVLASTSQEISNTVSDVMGKGVALVEALIRIGNHTEAVEVLIDGLYHWGRACTLTGNLRSPRQLVRLWVKETNKEAQRVLFDSLCNIQPPLSSSTFAILMQEELSAYNALEDELSTTKKEQVLDLLLNKVYVTKHDCYGRSRVLLEKARIARFGGPEALSRSMLCLSEAVSILEHACRVDQRDLASTELQNLLHQSAIILCVRGLCSYEVNPSTQQFVEDFSKGIKCWREVLQLVDEPSRRQDPIKEHPRSTSQFSSDLFGQEATGLLLDVADLAALKGFSELQDEIQDLLFDFAAARGDASAEEMFTSLWAQRQLGHVLCCVPHSLRFSALLSKRFGTQADSFEAWERYAKNSVSSLLDVRLRLIAGDLLSKGLFATGYKTDWAVGADAVKETASALASKGLKTSQALLDLAAVYHALSQHAFESGHLVEAVADSREALKLRLKCFNRTFQPSKRPVIEAVREAESRSLASVVGSSSQLDVAAHVSTRAWPAIYSAERQGPIPSQWRVLGDYLESLFQAGVLQERTGGVDEAEKDFVEGLRISNALHLPVAQAMFTSALGDIFRKRHLWKQAVDHFAKAQEVYREVDANLSCKLCIQAGKALLQVRIGDMLRHCSDENIMSALASERAIATSATSFDHALHRYQSVHEETRYLIGGCICSGGLGRVNSYPGEKTVMGEGQLGNGLSQGLQGEAVHRADAVNKMFESVPSSCVDSSQQDLLCSEMQQVSLSTEREASEVMQVQKGASAGQTVTVKRSARIKQKSLASAAKSSAELSGCDGVSTAKAGTLSSKARPQRRQRTRGGIEAEIHATAEVATKLESTSGMVTRTQSSNTSAGVSRRPQKTESGRVEPQAVCTASNEHAHEEGSRSMSHNLASTSHDSQECCCPCGQQTFPSISSMHSWTVLKWEQSGRRLRAQALTQQGKTYFKVGSYNSAEQSLQQSWAVLRSAGFQDASHSFEGPECPETLLFPLDEAWLLYHISRLRLRRDLAHEDSRLDWKSLQQTLTWLYRSLLLCHQVPPLLQKVANLLALLHVPTSSGGVCQHPGKSLGELHSLATYFHQAALGAPARQQHLAIVNSKLAALVAEPEKSLHTLGRKKCLEDMEQALRTVPHEANGVVACVETLVKGLSGSCVCCISVVEREHAFLLDPEQKSTAVWLLITHLGSQMGPVVMIVPAVPLTKGLCSPYYVDDNRGSQTDDCEEVIRHENIFLESVIPEFASIMEESRISTIGTGPMMTIAQKSAWWKWRTELDSRLSSLLCVVEDQWLGPWKCFLMGSPSNVVVADVMEKSAKKLRKRLQSTVKQDDEDKFCVEVDEKLVYLLLQGLSSLTSGQLEAGIAWIMGWGVSTPGGGLSSDRLSARRQQVISAAAEEFIAAYKASTEVNTDDATTCEGQTGNRMRGKTRNRRPAKRVAGQQKESTGACSSKTGYQLLSRLPVELVLDGNLQVLPWESLPCVRQCEMYRMPSLGSIHALMVQQSYEMADKALPGGHAGKRRAERTGSRSVNARNSFYLLNPSGDLASTQAAFEDWFAHEEGWKGKAGEVPSVDEVMEGLLEHDLFIYFGHGSGEQYLSGRRIRRLDNCAAALLMGCGSGRLAWRGNYDPVGVPLSYLMAGCPTAIANLWDVTDGDIDRFSRVLLHSWLGFSDGKGDEETKEKKAARSLCSIDDRGSNVLSTTLEHPAVVSRSATPSQVHMGSVAAGRSACKLPFLIGAAPVCYGIPTPIQST